MKFIIFALYVVVSAASSPLMAQPVTGTVSPAQTSPASQSRGTSPEQLFVYQVADEVLESLRKYPSIADSKGALEQVFSRYVDIEWVGQFVLGRHWTAANDAQKEKFLTSYRKFMVGGYTKRLRDYSGERYTVSTPRSLGNDRSALTMKAFRPAGAPVVIDYKIRKSGNGYKIYDLVVEGISLITTQRSEFDSIVNRNGLDFLIDALGKKAAKS